MTEVEGVKIDGGSVLLGALLGAGIGAVLGSLLARRRAEKKIAAEVAGVKAYYKDKTAAHAAGEGDHPVPPGAKPPLGELVPGSAHVIRRGRPVSYGPVLGPVPGGSGPSEVVSDEGDADGGDDEEGDLAAPTVLRDTTVPYVIMADEYREENLEFTKVSLTWYAVDKVLADERDSPLRDIALAGDFQDKFGQDSDDDHIVFIRNEALAIDIEIILNEGSFREIILGYGNPT